MTTVCSKVKKNAANTQIKAAGAADVKYHQTVAACGRLSPISDPTFCMSRLNEHVTLNCDQLTP